MTALNGTTGGVDSTLRALNRAGTRLRLWEGVIVGTAPVTPQTLRVTVGGDQVADLAEGALPADAIKLFLAAEPGDRPWATGTFPTIDFGEPRPVFRPYTIRRFGEGTFDVDVVLHGDGPGARWARTARPGDRLQWTGPRSEFWAAPGVDTHLLVGDATAVPGAVAILESLPAGAAQAVLQVADPAERLDVPGVTWVHDDPLPVVADLTLRGRVQAWVAGEAVLVRDLRRHLLGERGVARDDLQATGYWRRGMTVTETDAARLREFAKGAHADHHDVDLADVRAEA